MNDVRQAFEELESSQRGAVAVHRSGGGRPQAVFPGAFNPLHDGHREMQLLAHFRLGARVEFEISIENVDKPELGYDEVAQRIGQFDDDQVVWLTRAATFVEKSDIFPGATFVVGIDTMQRIGMPKYYEDDPAGLEEAIRSIIENRCRFLVYGRDVDGTFLELEDIPLSDDLLRICDGVPGDRFRSDISSTQLRPRRSD